MKKLRYISVFILCIQCAFNFANAQQQTFTATSQKQCQWDEATQNDKNCVEFKKNTPFLSTKQKTEFESRNR